MKEQDDTRMEKIVSLTKRRGFVYQGSEIYGGLAGTWDYGPYGVALKNNIKQLWWRRFVSGRHDMYGLDAAILMNARTWQASGHTETFSDPLVECEKCKRRFRADHLENTETCVECRGVLSEAKQFNMMFSTHVGATQDEDSVTYLRPETAQGIFVNFKNIIDSFHPKLPFGIGQIGKAFRNEIAPRDFIFRTREFEQMEVEYFVRSDGWQRSFDEWREVMHAFIQDDLGLDASKVSELEVKGDDLAHYSKRTIDFEFEYPFGRKELFGLAYRTDYDLTRHKEVSGEKLEYFDDQTGERFVPHVIEPSLGVDRAILAVLVSSYREDELGGETRTYLALPKQLAPVRVAVFPLLKNKPQLVEKAKEVYSLLAQHSDAIEFDDNGNIGKRYRRQDEIGTPYCVTIDFDTLEDDTVTVRDRDTGEQKRVVIKDLVSHVM
ncbi:MAG: glycine--tRNA ligase [bacterium]|nr:glycine--tRNA ligase [bacterium]